MEFSERAGTWPQRAITAIEWVVAATLVVLAALATWSILPEFTSVGLSPQGINGYTTILDGTLLVFVIAELFKIALAYIRHEGVIPTVMEAALVAVARKVVVLDAHATPSLFLMRAGALGLLLLALSVSWYLLSRANPEFAREPPRVE
jgi:uncharacterized membrane protein (DUF373 family)